jgi:hypothetical protein
LSFGRLDKVYLTATTTALSTAAAYTAYHILRRRRLKLFILSLILGDHFCPHVVSRIIRMTHHCLVSYTVRILNRHNINGRRSAVMSTTCLELFFSRTTRQDQIVNRVLVLNDFIGWRFIFINIYYRNA